MPNIHVVTDSGSDLPQSIKEKYGIKVVPLTIQFGEEIYQDGVELKANQFYERLNKSSDLPSTCQPSPADFVKCYEENTEPGDQIISIHLSSKVSGTYQSAVLASTMVDDREIHILDTKSASIGIGLVAVAVAEAIQNGATVEEAVREAERIIEKLQIYFVVDTLENLKRNGRIGAASAIVGSLLNIKPILTLDDGIVSPYDKVRGKNKAIRKIYDLLQEYTNNNPGRKIRVGITHANCLTEAEVIREKIKDELDIDDIMIEYIGPTIGVHVGAGTVALLWYPM